MRDPREGLSESGTIRTGADIRRVAESFRPVHQAATVMIQERETSASVYAYGSVVTGQARAGVSDVDLLTIGLTPSERVARLDEGLVVLDRLLRNNLQPFSGQFTTYQEARTTPGCVQQPRPSLIVAARGPKALRVAAIRGDVWSSYGGLEAITVDELVDVTRQRNEGLRVACESVGRDPASIGRSLLLVPNNGVDPWGDPDALRAFVEKLRAMNFDELVLHLPPPHRSAAFERTSLDVLPQLR